MIPNLSLSIFLLILNLNNLFVNILFHDISKALSIFKIKDKKLSPFLVYNINCKILILKILGYFESFLSFIFMNHLNHLHFKTNWIVKIPY